jgi:flagellin
MCVMSDVVLSAGVRQNLLSLQQTAHLMSVTQNRLATGKKVNSALDNPANFFTSQALNNRAGDLNALLDSIGQAQKTLEAADQGISALSKLVESAKSTAKQARQAAQPGAAGYSAVTITGDPTDESLGAFTGGTLANATVLGAGNIAIAVTVSGTTTNVTVNNAAIVGQSAGGLASAIQTAINGSAVGAGKISVTSGGAGNGAITMSALDADVDFTITANATTAEVGLTVDAVTNRVTSSTSLLDNIGVGGQGSILTVAANGGANQQITFGTDGSAGQVSTLAELNARIATLAGVTGSASNATFTLTAAQAATQTSLTVNSSLAGLTTALGLTATVGLPNSTGTTLGTAFVATPNAARTSLQSDFNSILAQIDALAKDASYNGINLLFGDDLKVLFNENGSSSLTIAGVTYDAASLGLSTVSGIGFQSDTVIDAALSQIDVALGTLRNQASKFGSNLNTVQARQDFTKKLINTLETGADNLVLADTNEEGANMLALQTRQQLSTTALSLSAQADQGVLRLFG